RGLLEKLIYCRNFEEAIKIYEAQIKSLEITRAETDDKIAEAVKIVEASQGKVKISEIAKAVHLSTRQLERRFKKSAGLSPKQFARARRIRATAVSIVEEWEMNWASRAAEMGFTDQAHLTHEFSMLMGRAEFVRRKGQTHRTRQTRQVTFPKCRKFTRRGRKTRLQSA
ncbi:MAG: helix-turn-helix domain-containing protein, partial [Acidobacteria bacterium]|nr:helix-turn-helix domain-containing protein [Acidobacteriota bacterium]